VTDTSATQRASAPQDVTGWAGWVVFAGIMLILLGAFQAIEGLVAVFGQAYYLVGPEGCRRNWAHHGPTGIGSSRGECRRKEHSTVERPCRVRPPAGRTSGCGPRPAPLT
jgi:hypothetical protein